MTKSTYSSKTCTGRTKPLSKAVWRRNYQPTTVPLLFDLNAVCYHVCLFVIIRLMGVSRLWELLLTLPGRWASTSSQAGVGSYSLMISLCDRLNLIIHYFGSSRTMVSSICLATTPTQPEEALPAGLRQLGPSLSLGIWH